MNINLILSLVFVSIGLIACGSSSKNTDAKKANNQKAEASTYVPTEADHLNNLSKLWKGFEVASRQGDVDWIKDHVTFESWQWLEDMTPLILDETEESLRQRPLHEVMLILSARFYHRNNLLPVIDEESLIRFTFSQSPLKKIFHRADLSPFWIEQEYAFRGLKRAPKVPLFFFLYEEGLWKINLLETLPLATKGVAAAILKMDKEAPELIIDVLDYDPRFEADSTLLDPNFMF